MLNKLKKLVDKLEKSIEENYCDVWMHDLSDTTGAHFGHLTDYHHMDSEGKIEIIEYDGFYKEFIELKEEIYKLNNKEIKQWREQ